MTHKLPRSPGVPEEMLKGRASELPASQPPPLGQSAALPHVKLSAVDAHRDVPAQRVPDRLIARTVAVDDPDDLVGHLPDPASVAWVRRGEGMVGWGEAARVTVPAGEDRFTAGEKWLRELFDSADITDEVGIPGSGPVAFGSFTFDPTSDGSVFVVPRVLLGRGSGRSWLTTIGDERGAQTPATPPAPPAEVSWHDGSLTAPQWERAVSSAVARIQAGDLSKVVLARDLGPGRRPPRFDGWVPGP